MLKLLQNRLGNYSILEGVGLVVLLGVVFWISTSLFQVRQAEFALEKNANKTGLENVVRTVADY